MQNRFSISKRIIEDILSIDKKLALRRREGEDEGLTLETSALNLFT